MEISLVGEVDLSTAGTLSALLMGIVADAPPRVVVDVGGVSFLDSSGIKCLVEVATCAAGTGCSLVVRSPTSSIERVFAICGVDELLAGAAPAATVPRIVSIVTVSDRSIYSIGALARMLGCLAGDAAILGGPLRRRGARAQRRVAAVVLARSPRPAPLRLRADGARPQRGRRASSARRTPRDGNPRARRSPSRESRPNARSCSSNAIRTRPSSPSTSCAPRATTCTSCGRSPMPSVSSANSSVDLAIVDLMIGGGAGLALCDQLAGTVPVLAVSALDQTRPRARRRARRRSFASRSTR